MKGHSLIDFFANSCQVKDDMPTLSAFVFDNPVKYDTLR